jgi:hypothetical protein
MEIELLQNWILEAFSVGDINRAQMMSITLNLLLREMK